MATLGYGRDYVYPHDAPDAFVARNNLPEPLAKALFYEPSRSGVEGA